MQDIIRRKFPNWNVLHNYSKAYNGRIWLLWVGAWQIQLLAISDQSISVCVEFNSHKFYFSAIYGCNTCKDQRRLWSHLKSIHNSVQEEPWMLARDFNVIAGPNESFSYLDSFVTF